MSIIKMNKAMMEERIRLIIKAKNITAASFADRIGVQRSAISHVLSGRNNPSLDFIQRILKAFPDINAEWLIGGKGEMRKDIVELFSEHMRNAETTTAVQTQKEVKVAPTLFDIPVEEETNTLSVDKTQDVLRRLTSGDTSVDSVVKNENTQTTTSPSESNIQDPVVETAKIFKSEKDIDRIVVFYKDRTFREYKPD